jgi:hypothetical protein
MANMPDVMEAVRPAAGGKPIFQADFGPERCTRRVRQQK